MPKRKLTLTVDAAVIARAHQYSAERGTSVSQLVANYLGTLSAPDAGASEHTPEVRRLLGVLPRDPSSREDYREAYREHLAAKYGVGPLPPDAGATE